MASSYFLFLHFLYLYAIVKKKLLVSDLVTCYSRDAQHEWMKLSSEII